MAECVDLDDLKKQYKELQTKYSLPDFQKLAEDFDIEKTQEKETSFLLREIRRIINEKLSAYMHLFESLVNPASSSIFVFTLLKSTDEKDKELIKEVYKKFSKIQMRMMKLDTIYNQDQEAEFIKNIFTQWQELKKQINDLLEKLDKNFDLNNSSIKRGYFG